MQYFQRLESGDKIFFIDDKYQIKEIKLDYEHLVKDQKNRRLIDRPYQLSSRVAKFGKVRLTKVTAHEEMDWSIAGHYLKRWRTFEDTDKFAYISREDAEAALESQISKEERFEFLFNSVKKDLDYYVKTIKSTLDQYFNDIDSLHLEDAADESDDHQKIIELYHSLIDF